MIPGEILIIELEEIADSSSFPRETEGKEGEREDRVEKRRPPSINGDGERLGGAALKNP